MASLATSVVFLMHRYLIRKSMILKCKSPLRKCYAVEHCFSGYLSNGRVFTVRNCLTTAQIWKHQIGSEPSRAIEFATPLYRHYALNQSERLDRSRQFRT